LKHYYDIDTFVGSVTNYVATYSEFGVEKTNSLWKIFL